MKNNKKKIRHEIHDYIKNNKETKLNPFKEYKIEQLEDDYFRVSIDMDRIYYHIEILHDQRFILTYFIDEETSFPKEEFGNMKDTLCHIDMVERMRDNSTEIRELRWDFMAKIDALTTIIKEQDYKIDTIEKIKRKVNYGTIVLFYDNKKNREKACKLFLDLGFYSADLIEGREESKYGMKGKFGLLIWLNVY